MGHQRPYPIVQWLTLHRIVQIHLLNLLGGSPYGAPPSNQIAYEVPPGDNFVHQLAATGSRVMMHASREYEDEPNTRPVWTIVVWDIKTRDPVNALWFGNSHALLTSLPRCSIFRPAMGTH